jgi:hypothetical protein
MALSQLLRSVKFANVQHVLNAPSAQNVEPVIAATVIADAIVTVETHAEIIASHTAAAEQLLQMVNS